jgi:hypothetical protein
MDELLTDAAACADRYLADLPNRPVAPTAAALEALKELATPLQAHPLDPARVLEELDDIGSPATVATAGGRYFGFALSRTLKQRPRQDTEAVSSPGR